METDERYEAVSALLRELEKDLVRTVRARDGAQHMAKELGERAIEIEARIDQVSKLEQRLRRAQPDLLDVVEQGLKLFDESYDGEPLTMEQATLFGQAQLARQKARGV